MKRLILILAIVISSALSVNGQVAIPMEKGWFVDNDGNRTECMIRDSDWLNNPTSFKYRLDGSDVVNTASIDEVSEFGTYSGVKYVRRLVKVCVTPVSPENKATDYIYKMHKAFLKVLSEGNVNLYVYKPEKAGLNFYTSTGDHSIAELLVYQEYVEDGIIKENITFKRQVLAALGNSSAYRGAVENLKYSQDSLMSLFSEFNGSTHPAKKAVDLKISGQLAFAACPFYNVVDETRPDIYRYEMGPVITPGIGAEFEIIMPFNKGRWEILVNPVLYGYKKTQEYWSRELRSDAVASQLYLELYVALRYGFDIGDKFRVYANAGYGIDAGLKSWMHFYPIGEVGAAVGGTPVFGLGCRYGNRFSLELRYGSPKDQIDRTYSWATESPRIGLMLGYTFGK